MNSIKAIFDHECQHLTIDERFLKQIHLYVIGFINRDEQYVRFFGGNLMGVYPVRFKSSDKYAWVEDIVHVDEYAVKTHMRNVPGIAEHWVRANDIVNLSCVYLCHRICAADHLTPVQKENAMVDVLLVMQFRLLCSLIAHYYRYTVDEAVATAVYAALSKKFAIKQYGSWHGVLVARAKDVIAKTSIHHQTIVRFDDDKAIVYMISDIQTRLKAIMKKLYVVLEEVRKQNTKILTVGGSIELDGRMVVRDTTSNYAPYRRYLSEIVADPRHFIKAELVGVIASAMHTMPERLLIESLQYISAEAGSNNPLVTELLDETLLHAFEYLSTDRRAREKFTDLPALIGKLRALYMASRSSDPSLLKMREVGESLVTHAIKSRNPSIIAAVRTGVLLYIIVRTFSKNHYG